MCRWAESSPHDRLGYGSQTSLSGIQNLYATSQEKRPALRLTQAVPRNKCSAGSWLEMRHMGHCTRVLISLNSVKRKYFSTLVSENLPQQCGRGTNPGKTSWIARSDSYWPWHICRPIPFRSTICDCNPSSANGCRLYILHKAQPSESNLPSG